MKRIIAPIFIATLYLVLYVIIAELDATTRITLMLFSLSPIPVLWMVYKVLRDGEPSTYTFTERFYEDYAYARAEIREEAEEIQQELNKA